jgi:predicted transcriptional regulator
MSATTTIRVSADDRALLREIAETLGRSQQDIVHDALEYFRRAQVLRAMNAAFAALRAEPSQWASVLAERADWDAVIDDVALGDAA